RLDLLEQGEVEAANAHLTIRIQGVRAMAEEEPAATVAVCPEASVLPRRDAERRRNHAPAAAAGASTAHPGIGAGSVCHPTRARGHAGDLRVSKQPAAPTVRQAVVHWLGEPGVAGSRLATGAPQAQADPGAHEPVPASGFVRALPHTLTWT